MAQAEAEAERGASVVCVVNGSIGKGWASGCGWCIVVVEAIGCVVYICCDGWMAFYIQ